MLFKFSFVLSSIIITISINIAHISTAYANPSQHEIFPLLEGETLNGKNVSLPQAIEGNTAWIVIGFTKDSQKATATCSEKLAITFKNQGYSIAVIQGAPFFVKGMIKNSIRSSVPENRRDRFFVLSEGRSVMEPVAGFEEKAKDEAYIIGVRSRSPKEYDIVFKIHGICDEPFLSSVTKNIQNLIN